MEKVGKVSKLLFYPVKSCRGIEVPEMECTYSGLRYGDIGDRSWVVQNRAGIAVTGKVIPRICLIIPSFHGDMLHLDAEGMSTLKVPRDISKDANEIIPVKMTLEGALGVDCGDEAGEWLSKVLGKEGMRLVFAASGLTLRHLKDFSMTAPLVTDKDEILFHDGSPGTLLPEASVEDLNTRLKKPVDVLQFRPNIVVSDTSAPYVEDGWKHLSAGDSQWWVTAPDPRCAFTPVDPWTGIKDPDDEPNATLRKYRIVPLPESMKHKADRPSLAMLFIVKKPGKIRVGDPIMSVTEGSAV